MDTSDDVPAPGLLAKTPLKGQLNCIGISFLDADKRGLSGFFKFMNDVICVYPPEAD